MNVEYTIIAASANMDNAKKLAAVGNINGAKRFYAEAAKKYLELSKMVPDRAYEFINLATQCSKYAESPTVNNTPKTATQPAYNGNSAAGNVEITASPHDNAENISQNEKIKYYHDKFGLDVSFPNEQLSFNDIVGLEKVKRELNNDLILPLREAWAYEAYGLKVGGKVLLYGPPGTGKTSIGKALAYEFGGPFLAIPCAGLIDSKIGESGHAIEDLFNKVRTAVKEDNTPIVLFLDEFDQIAADRHGNVTAGETVPTLLRQLDGFDVDNHNIVVVAATNNKDTLDSAVISRFMCQYIPLPDDNARAAMFQMHLMRACREDNDACRTLKAKLVNVNYDTLAKKTEGFSGRDISKIVETFLRMLAFNDIQNRHASNPVELDPMQTLINIIKEYE